MWSNFHLLADVAVMVSDNEERYAKKGKSKIIYEEHDHEEDSVKKHFTRRSYLKQHCDILNGSSSIMNLGCLKSPLAESEKKKDPRNPNNESSSPSSCLTESTSRKRRAQKQRKSKGGFKKAKIVSLPFVERMVPDWVFQAMRRIKSDVENPRMMFERTLTASDVKSTQSRLLIPFNMLIINDFLTPMEVRALNKKENNKEDEDVGVGTILVNEKFEKWGLRFKVWSMEKKSGKGTLNYALNRGWNDVVEGNNLKPNDNIDLWTFRCRGVLCFALDLSKRG